MNLEKGISVTSGNETEKPRPFRFNEGLITRFKNFVDLTAQDPSSRGVVTNQHDWACGLMCLPPRPGKRASPGGWPSTPKEPASRVASKMNVEFKTRAGDKWTSLRHFDSGPGAEAAILTGPRSISLSATSRTTTASVSAKRLTSPGNTILLNGRMRAGYGTSTVPQCSSSKECTAVSCRTMLQTSSASSSWS